MSLYRTKEGDRIDLIVLKHYGDLKHLNDVIGANKHLFKKPMNLESNIDIELPEFDDPSSEYFISSVDNPVEREPLW